jgi:hypothetical protein
MPKRKETAGKGTKPAKLRTAELMMMSRIIMAVPAEERRPALLRYPPGEGPLRIGICHWR